ncbi:MAG: TRAP transporter small permease [Saprospiraceae bacterium]|nr:TRAP transporter small permease [Saprospiraceae bacterium]
MEKYISRFLKYGTLLSTYALIGSVLLQIFARFFLANTPSWTEEASRLFFIYATSFAAGLALKNKYYVHLDLFFDRLSERAKKIILVLIPVLILSLFVLLSIFSIQFILLGHQEFSPSMKTRMSLAFCSMFIMGASISYFAFLDLKKAIKNSRL